MVMSWENNCVALFGLNCSWWGGFIVGLQIGMFIVILIFLISSYFKDKKNKNRCERCSYKEWFTKNRGKK